MAHQESKKGWFHKATGKTFLIKEGLCAFLGIEESMFNTKLASGEITEVKKVKEKKGKNAVTVEYNGVVYPSYRDLCNALNINCSTFGSRLRKGLTVEEAIEKGLQNVGPKSN